MEERQQEHPAAAERVLLRGAANARDPRRVARQQLGREVPERADHLRLDQLHLALQVGTAGVDLLGLGIAIAGRTALEDVGDEDVLATHADPLEQFAEEAARAPDEREALAILLRARRLAHEHEVGVRVAGAEDDAIAGLMQGAALADRGLVVDLHQRLAPGGGVHQRFSERARSAARRRAKRSLAPPRSIPRFDSERHFWFALIRRWI